MNWPTHEFLATTLLIVIILYLGFMYYLERKRQNRRNGR